MSEGNKLPKGWAEAMLGDVLRIIRGVSYKKEQASSTPRASYVPLLRATNIGAGLDFDELVYVPNFCVDQEQMLVAGDIVVASSSGSKTVVGKASRLTADWHGSFGAFCMGLRVEPPVDSQYICYFMQTHEYRHQISELASGSNINNLRRDHIESFPFRLAPLSEQQRIVEKIEELFSDLDAGVASLERAKANLKRYRASVLKSAVEGRLTEEWRKENPQAEDGQMHLDGILHERREKWEQDQLAKFKAKGKEPPKHWQSKYEGPSAPDTSQLPELPKGWAWTTISLLAEHTPHAIGAGPFGTIFKAKDFRPTGIPIIFLRHVKAGEYSTRKPGFMSTDIWHRLFEEEYSVFGGELLVTKLGEPPGTACIYPPAIGPAMVTPDVIKMRVRSGVADTRFLMHYMNSQVGQSFTSGKAFGTTRPRLTLPLFKELPVFLPPLAEQEQIVTLVEERLSQIESAEKTIDAELIRSKRLRQGILKRAFEGKLVSQDPKDEPASVLLERIKAGKETEQPKKTKKSKAKSK
jgi:type I restriction enzyme S subunit